MQNNLQGAVPRRYKYVAVRSVDAIDEAKEKNSAQFSVDFNNTQFSQDRIINLSLKSVHFPNEFNNVYPGHNELLFDLPGYPSGPLVKITLRTGQYTNAEMADLIIQTLSELGDPVNATSSIDSNGVLTILFITPITGAKLIGVSDPTYSANFAISLGCGTPSSGNLLLPTLTLKNPMNLMSPFACGVWMYLNICDTQTIESNQAITTLAKILPLNVPTGECFHWEAVNPEMTTFSFPEVRHLGRVTVSLRDIFGNHLSLAENQHMAYTFMIGLY